MQTVIDMAFKAANSDATVLILGESGTGKSVLARAMHARSPRKGAAFVTVSCPVFRVNFWRANFSVTSKEHLQAPLRIPRAKSPPPMAGRFYWMKLAICPWKFSRSCSDCCKNGNMSAWARPNRAERTCA